MTAQMVLGGDPNKLNAAGYTKGDLLAADSTGLLEPVPVGVNGTVLTADSGTVEGVDWGAGGGGGGGTPSNTVVSETTFGQASGAGVAVTYSRGDHTHGTPASQLASPTFTGTATFSGRYISTPDVLIDAATIATDASLGNHFRVTLGGNRTLGAPTNPTDGQRVIWEIIQDGAGGHTLGYNAVFVFGPITPTTIASGVNAVTFLGAVYSAARAVWDVLAFGAGY